MKSVKASSTQHMARSRHLAARALVASGRMRMECVSTLMFSFLVFCGVAHAQTYVQATANSGSASSLSVSFASNTTAGDTILVGFDFTSTFASITDSQGNVFTEVGSQLTTPGGISTRLYYASNIKGGADTVTINLSASSSIEAYLSEYGGVAQVSPIDAQAGASGSAAAVSSGNATTTVAGDLIYGFCIADGSCTVWRRFYRAVHIQQQPRRGRDRWHPGHVRRQRLL